MEGTQRGLPLKFIRNIPGGGGVYTAMNHTSFARAHGKLCEDLSEECNDMLMEKLNLRNADEMKAAGI